MTVANYVSGRSNGGFKFRSTPRLYPGGRPRDGHTNERDHMTGQARRAQLRVRDGDGPYAIPLVCYLPRHVYIQRYLQPDTGRDYGDTGNSTLSAPLRSVLCPPRMITAPVSELVGCS